MNDGAKPSPKEVIEEARALLGRVADFHEKLTGVSSGPAGLEELTRGVREAGDALDSAIRAAVRVAASHASAPARAKADGDLDARVAGEMEALEEGAGADEPEELRLVGALRSIENVVEEEKLVIDAADYRFVERAPALLEGLDEADRSGLKGARVIADCVRFMDSLEREYALPRGGSLARTFGSLRCLLAEYLEKTHDLRFVPDPRVEGSGDPEALARLPQRKALKFPSGAPAGEALGLFKRGIERPAETGAERPAKTEPPEVLVSLGRTSDAFELVNRVSYSLLKAAGMPSPERQARAVAFKEIRRKYLPELAGALSRGVGTKQGEDKEATVLRYVVNVMQPLSRDGTLAEPVKEIVAALKERGQSAIPARTGVQFDESFGTGKFERRMIPSDEPPGTVVRVMQIGFVNREGVPVQKAILGVSAGAGQ